MTLAAAILIPVCLLLAVWSFGLLYEGFVADGYSGAFSFPLVDEAAAERAYGRLAADAPIGGQKVAVDRLIAVDPANPDSWNAAAYVAYEEAGDMSPAAREALDHSYAVSALDRTGGAWRIGFAFAYWSKLPSGLRDHVLAEARVRLQDPELGPPLREQLRDIDDPAGRVAAAALLLARP
jgi:hypothetical protein